MTVTRQLLGHNRFLRALFSRGTHPKQWVFKIHLNMGGGYGWWVFNRKFFIPTGWTFYFGRHVVGHKTTHGRLKILLGRRPDHVHYRFPWAIGLSRGGNTPWVNG